MITVRIARDVPSRCAVLAVAHAANHVAAPLSWYQAQRLALPLRQRATWWLLEEDGEPASSLLCYPLLLRDGERIFPAYGLGAVATRPDRQRRGHAQRLCQVAMEEAGASVGLLFSAIPPAYYAKLGFRTVPVTEHACTDLRLLVHSGPAEALRPIAPLLELELLMRAYDQLPGICPHRAADGWRRSFEKNPEDCFFAVPGGYVRLAADDEGLEVVELVADDPAAVWRAAGALALALELPALTTWLQPPADVLPCFIERDRSRTQLMAAGLGETPDVWVSSADYF